MAVNHPTRIAHRYAFENGVLHRVACFELPEMQEKTRVAYQALEFIRDPSPFLNRFLGENGGAKPSAASADARLRLAAAVYLMTIEDLFAQEWFEDGVTIGDGDVVGASHFDPFCFEKAIRLLWSFEREISEVAAGGPRPDVNAVFGLRMREYKRIVCSAPIARLLIEARRRNIPAMNLSGFTDVFQFGYGAQRRRYHMAKTGSTPQIAGMLTTYKPMLTDILRRNGLPTPDNSVVANIDAALRWAKARGTPVVIKPTSQDMGVGVTTNITTESGLKTAFQAASQFGAVMIESQIPGVQFRIVVIDGQPLASYRIIAAFVVGDGRASIAKLASDKTAARAVDPDTAGKDFPDPNSPQVAQLLSEQGYSAETVPEEGVVVNLDNVANAARGGERQFFDLADIHPDNLRMAQRAADLFDIDFAGIDFITEDISVSFVDGVGAINEVNISPAMPFANLGEIYFEHSYRDDNNEAISITVIVGELTELDVEALNEIWFAKFPEAGKIAVLNGQVFTSQGLEPYTSRTPHGIWQSALANGRMQKALLHISPDHLAARGFPVTYFDRVFFLPNQDGTAPQATSDPSIAAVAEACGGECATNSLAEIFNQLP